MQSRFYLSLMLISGLVLLMFMAFAGYRELAPEWKKYQKEYKELLVKGAKDENAKKMAKNFSVELQQLYLGDLKRVDRCTSCHIGYDNPAMANAKLPFKQHSGDYLKNHSVEKYGCTICHYGQGRAPEKDEAHAAIKATAHAAGAGAQEKQARKAAPTGEEHKVHWDFPIIPVQYIQSSCSQCHDSEFLKNKGGGKVVKGEEFFKEKGCKGCHKLNSIGGDLGKALDGVGSQPIAYFPMKDVAGERNTYSWHKQHFVDPRNLVPESEMKVNVTEEEADFLATYVLSLRAEEVPKKYRRIRDIAPAAAPDGEALYKMYCIGCHTTGKESMYDEIFRRTIPSIKNPAFLKAVDDKYIKTVVTEGRAGTQMTSWKTTAAGLTEQEVDKIVSYVANDRPKDKPELFDVTKYKADTKRGEDIYKVRCALCHGKKGEGALGINLRNPVVQNADLQFLAMTARDGRANTPMPPFGKKGVGLSDQDLLDVVSYVKTLSKAKK